MYKMYTFYLLLIALSGVYSSLLSNNDNFDETRERQYKMEVQCSNKLNLPEKARFPRLMDPELNSTEEYKTFLRCFADGMKLLNNNKVRWENLRRFLRVHIEKLHVRMLQLEIVDLCKNSVVEGTDGTENFFQVVKCLRTEGLEALSTAEKFDEAIENEISVTTSCFEQFDVYDEDLCTKLSDPSATISNDVKCFLKCFAEGMKLLNENKVNWEAVKNLSKVHNRKNSAELETLEKCKKSVVEGEDGCENSYQMFKCLSVNPPKVFTDLQGLYQSYVRTIKVTKECKRDPSFSNELAFSNYPFVKVWNTSAETKQYKCYVKCFVEGMKFLHDGKFDWDNMRMTIYMQPYFFERKTMLEAWETCQTKVVVGEDLCESSYQLNKCMVVESEKVREMLGIEAMLELGGQYK